MNQLEACHSLFSKSKNERTTSSVIKLRLSNINIRPFRMMQLTWVESGSVNGRIDGVSGIVGDHIRLLFDKMLNWVLNRIELQSQTHERTQIIQYCIVSTTFSHLNDIRLPRQICSYKHNNLGWNAYRHTLTLDRMAFPL